jgi:hypothetical protein
MPTASGADSSAAASAWVPSRRLCSRVVTASSAGVGSVVAA